MTRADETLNNMPVGGTRDIFSCLSRVTNRALEGPWEGNKGGWRGEAKRGRGGGGEREKEESHFVVPRVFTGDKPT